MDHLRWIGQYIVDRRPDVVVHLGDHADMPSLSSYDKGKKSFEGRRYVADIESANRAFDYLNQPLIDENHRLAANKKAQWWPERHILLGNHEERIARAAENSPELDGTIGYDDLNYKEHGWEVHDFLEPVNIDGVYYAHYFYNPNSGIPFGGTLETRLKNIGHSFTQGHTQTLMYGLRFVNNRSHHGLVAGACLAPHHRVLTSDLRYIPLGEVEVGQKLVSFDETVEESYRRGRSYKTGTVLAVRNSKKPVRRVIFDDDTEFIVTHDHRWLTRVGGQTAIKHNGTYAWRETDSMRKGTLVPQPLDVWKENTSYEAGYLSGIFDGEGCLYTRQTSGGRIAQLSFSQKPGLVWDKSVECIESLVGVDAISYQNDRGINSGRLKGGLPSIARLLGEVRPTRLLSKFEPEMLGQMTCPSERNRKIVAIEDAGYQDIVEIDIDAKTMIVEGQPHHNCYQHDEDYKGPQGNHHWRGIIMKHEVADGSYDPMFVSLNYLCNRYEGKPLEKFKPKVFS